jgi:hypothetical protein
VNQGRYNSVAMFPHLIQNLAGAGGLHAEKQVFSIALATVVAVLISIATFRVRAQAPKTPYPAMAALDQYLIADANSEMALASDDSHDVGWQMVGRNARSAGSALMLLRRGCG